MKERRALVSTIGLVVVIIGLITLFIIVVAPATGIGTIVYSRQSLANVENRTPKPVRIIHLDTPNSVKAIYMSQCAAADIPFRKKIIALVESTEINSVVIDVKDFTGTVSFNREKKQGEEILKGNGCVVGDMKQFITALHKKGIYVIGRITVFQDPLYAKIYPRLAVQSKKTGLPWKDFNGLKFIDVGARPFWSYIVSIARNARDIGFDELNFDYIRYPSDGPMSDVQFNHSDYTKRPAELERFFAYLSQKMQVPDAYGFIPKLSADLFGMTAVTTDDLRIGQVLERATPYFDYIDPMVYPSHYPSGFIGYKNPSDHAYRVVKYSLDKAVARVTATTTTVGSFAYTRIGTSTPAVYSKPARSKNVIRPWLQDFNYKGEYGPVKVKKQIQATYDSGMNSWMLWSPSNYYTKSALIQN